MGDYNCSVNPFTDRAICFDNEMHRAPPEVEAHENQVRAESEARDPGWLMSFVPKDVPQLLREVELSAGLKAGEALPALRSAARAPVVGLLAAGVAVVAYGAVRLFGHPSHPAADAGTEAQPKPQSAPEDPNVERRIPLESAEPELDALRAVAQASTEPAAEKKAPRLSEIESENENGDEAEQADAAKPEATNDNAFNRLDPQALAKRDALIKQHRAFVAFLARKEFSNRGVPLDELIAEGYKGLIKAAEKFDESRGVKFTTYAKWWITASFRDLIEKTQDRGMVMRRFESNVEDALGRLRKAAIDAGIDKPVFSDEDVAREMRMPLDEFHTTKELLKLARARVSLDSPVPGPDGGARQTIADRLPAVDWKDPGENMDQQKYRALIHQAIGSLPDTLRYIVTQRVFEERKLKDIGQELGVSRERVRQLEAKAFKAMREALAENNITSLRD